MGQTHSMTMGLLVTSLQENGQPNHQHANLPYILQAAFFKTLMFKGILQPEIERMLENKKNSRTSGMSEWNIETSGR